jgi:hypothetical protein
MKAPRGPVDRSRPSGTGQRSAADSPSRGLGDAGEVLGADHPLARTIDALASVDRQALAVAGILLASVIAGVEHAQWAPAMALAAAAVLGVLLVAAAGLSHREHDLVLALIIDGHEELPITAVQAERERLMSPRIQACLLATLTALRENRCRYHPPTLTGLLVSCNPRVLAAAGEELREVIDRLSDEQPSAQGAAAVQRLLTNPRSALYGQDPERLRHQARRITHLLATLPDATMSPTHAGRAARIP